MEVRWWLGDEVKGSDLSSSAVIGSGNSIIFSSFSAIFLSSSSRLGWLDNSTAERAALERAAQNETWYGGKATEMILCSLC